MLFLSLPLLALAGLGFAHPKPPTLTFLYSADVKFGAPADIGNTPLGQRAVIPVAGGTFSGPKLKGTVGVGLDYGLTDAKGTFNPDAVYVLKTSDGANILVTEKGHAPNVQLVFETASDSKYAWLNSVTAIAVVSQSSGGISINVWQHSA